MTKYVSLRLWHPYMYGWHLIFKDGIPVCCIDDENLQKLKEINDSGSKSESAIKYHLKFLGKEILSEFKLYEVDPSKSTIIEGEIETEFISAFYRYFGEILQDGSPMIDSDMECLPLLQRYFPKNEQYICADLGAGSGRYSEVLCNHVQKVYACDIEVSRLQNKVLHQNIVITKCNIQNLPFQDNYFDFVMCNYVLEHVGNPYNVISEIIRTLKPNGEFLIAIPSFNYNAIYEAKVLKQLPTLNFEHLRSFTGETGVHPWEEPTQNVTEHIQNIGGEIKEIRGANIIDGLDKESVTFISRSIDLPKYSSSNIYPYNHFGSQTIIYGTKR